MCICQVVHKDNLPLKSFALISQSERINLSYPFKSIHTPLHNQCLFLFLFFLLLFILILKTQVTQAC